MKSLPDYDSWLMQGFEDNELSFYDESELEKLCDYLKKNLNLTDDEIAERSEKIEELYFADHSFKFILNQIKEDIEEEKEDE